MDGFSNSNGDTYNGQYKPFVGTPSVEIKFERENYSDVNNLQNQQYVYGDPQYQQNAYGQQPYSQEFSTAPDAGLQPIPVQTQYYGNEMTPIPTGGGNGSVQDFSPRKISPPIAKKVQPQVQILFEIRYDLMV